MMLSAAALARSAARSALRSGATRGHATLRGAAPLHAEGCSHHDVDQLEIPAAINGEGSLAVLFGGFGFQPKQMRRHQELYEQHGFTTLPVFSSISELTTKKHAPARGEHFARIIEAEDKDFAMHVISGSFWTALYTLDEMDPVFRETRLKAIVFDSSPPSPDIYAFGGWLCYAYKLNARRWQPIVSQLFRPYCWYKGINKDFAAECDRLMKSVVPKGCHTLFMHGRNDPVLNTQYVSDYASYLRDTTSASCVELLFDKSRHSMGIVDHPQLYKSCHVNRLLVKVDEWRPADSSDIYISREGPAAKSPPTTIVQEPTVAEVEEPQPVKAYA